MAEVGSAGILVWCRPVPAKTPCRFCGRIGFVRLEHVMTKGQAYRHYYCGSCDRTWQTLDEPPPPEGATQAAQRNKTKSSE
jgi:hypothetical protein